MTSIYHLRFVEMSSFCLIATYLNVMTKSWTEHELLERSLRRTLKLVFQRIIILQYILSKNQCKDIKLKVYNLFTNRNKTVNHTLRLIKTALDVFFHYNVL